jgi:predicted transcriptional regulator
MLARALAAAGHRQRLAILFKLLYGAASYRVLQAWTGMKVGPLYHHLNQLRLAGLVESRSRNVYCLTRSGQNVALGCIALAPLLRG